MVLENLNFTGADLNPNKKNSFFAGNGELNMTNVSIVDFGCREFIERYGYSSNMYNVTIDNSCTGFTHYGHLFMNFFSIINIPTDRMKMIGFDYG